MKRFLAFLLFLPCAAQAAPEHARFRGMAEITRQLSVRLAPPGDPVPLLDYVPAEGLATLLGTWNSFGGEHVFRNGDPNPVNMLIWHGTFASFAKALGGGCARPPFEVNATFRATLAKLCAWTKEQGREALLELWLALVGYNAPEAEFTEWRDFVLKTYGGRPAAEAIEAAALAALMNPYFLLDR